MSEFEKQRKNLQIILCKNYSEKNGKYQNFCKILHFTSIIHEWVKTEFFRVLSRTGSKLAKFPKLSDRKII